MTTFKLQVLQTYIAFLRHEIYLRYCMNNIHRSFFMLILNFNDVQGTMFTIDANISSVTKVERMRQLLTLPICAETVKKMFSILSTCFDD
ncbi:hypothetical protein Hanom_Chr04g00304151 [Helianthus anomalus]